MARRTYTLTELMGLRTNHIPDEILPMARNPEIADIIRRPGRESSSASGTSCKPSTIRHKDDSSVTSDELIFKGTVSRRMGRELAREASHNSLRAPTREVPRDTARDITQDPPYDPSRPMEWKYRGRSETEAATTEPIPAPTGAPAQRDEGFQRFYKAVVSPTHVRVTAGGRIVPNTRGPPSPTAKRESDNSVMDSQSVSDKEVSSKPLAASVGLGQPVPTMPQLMTGYPPGFQPLQAPVSFVPMALGTHLPPGFSFPQGTTAPLATGNTLKDMHNAKMTDDDKQGKTKSSLPEPFYYNGQIIYPVGAFPGHLGNPMVPVHVVGIPHGVAPQMPGQYIPPQPTQPSAAPTGSSYAPSNQSLSGISPVVNHIVPANANFNAAAAPPISSIRPSDITKKQIASFKQNLKYHEDQLQYNRHQIDEKDMEQKIQIIKGHIHKFETTLRTQLEYEDAHFKTAQGKEDKKPPQPSTVAEEARTSSQPSGPAGPAGPLGYAAPATKKEMDEAINRRLALATYGINTNIGEGAKAMFRGPMEPAFPGINGFPSTVGLPSDAALAPVFHPRGYASTWTGTQYAREMKAYEEAEKRLLATESKSLEHLRVSEQRSVSQPFPAHMALPVQAEDNPRTSDDSGSSVRNGTKQPSNFGVPYLLGTLPKGVNPRTARDQDYCYKRPLTEEERRARFLYWGKAPKSAVKGLPKYDGKHFYPPSPVKERSVELSQESNHRATDSDGDPFRPMTPLQRADTKGVSASEDNCTASRLTRTISFETQVNGGSEDYIVGGASLKFEDNAGHNSVGPADRRPENPGAKLWQTMLKKGPTSSALSSTTAQGVVISNVPEKRGENCPPGGVSSLEDQFKHLAVDVATRRDLTTAFGM
ncbi:hypothetical protein CHGG_08243 [Chaetomium globosum CBS 148.51]|uniref:Uncharacterized protein n=1 Tax=Chaetomium globosum (strain ATCC 6205 / CBS 148.51 / DSM 1962 / NBRC 6347 / NRRL 1970) TaxID=306901 RepID=Q2GUW1_CHAGB|nr:uncharacterized protein CHGG_08243 [Chaetomium globosum CBS 148.51]EAQ86990.1 hypothetical protein CHGG_08243 [Chaetomium globosum CBS 148.51]